MVQGSGIIEDLPVCFYFRGFDFILLSLRGVRGVLWCKRCRDLRDVITCYGLQDVVHAVT